MEKNKGGGLVKQCGGQVIELNGVFYLEIIQKLLVGGNTALSHWDRVKQILKGHHDTLLTSGLTASKLFFFKCLFSLLLNKAVLNFHGGFVLLPDSPYC